MRGLFSCIGAKEKNQKNVAYGRGCVHACGQPAPLRTRFHGGGRLGVGAEAMILDLTPVGGSIFGLLCRSFFHQGVFTEQISSSASPDMQSILLCVRGVDLLILHFPKFWHFIEETKFSFQKRRLLRAINFDTYMKSIWSLSARQKKSVEMTMSTWKTKQALETWRLLETRWLKKLPKIDPATTKI